VVSTQASLFGGTKDLKAAEMAAIYGKGQKITKDFFDTAEEEVLKALKGFAENAEGEDAFQKLLFAEDTARGFAFIELCRKRYDVIVMNPPFGASSVSTEAYFKDNYPSWGKNILCCFFSRMNNLLELEGGLGSIYDRTVLIKSSYELFRQDSLIGKITHMIDTGWGVLDANVETTATIQSKFKHKDNAVFINLQNDDAKEKSLLLAVSSESSQKWLNSAHFKNLPNSVIGYDWDDDIINLFHSFKGLIDTGAQVREGHNLVSNEHFRVFWEVTNFRNYRTLYNGGSFSMFYSIYRDKTLYGNEASLVKHNKKVTLRNLSFHGIQGICYGKRGDVLDAHVFKEDMIFTSEGKALPGLNYNDSLLVLAFLNSSLVQYLLNLYCGQHKHVGYVNILPFPNLTSEQRENIIQNAKQIIELKKSGYSYDETNLEYLGLIKRVGNLKHFGESLLEFQKSLIENHKKYEKAISFNDSNWIEVSGIGPSAINIVEANKSMRPKEEFFFTSYLVKHDMFKSELIKEFIQFAVGVVFGRWNCESTVQYLHQDSEIFKKLPDAPILVNVEGESPSFSIVSLGFVSNDNVTKESLFTRLNQFFKESGIDIDELASISKIESEYGGIENYINNPNGFFNYHFLRYTKSRREAPIYLPLATSSNSFIVWLYYPSLDENTLFSVVNELVDPKIKAIAKEVEVLEFNGSAKELNDQKEFLAELEDFKEELLRVAQLPYKSNQDDGVLITAAPLHNLFRHTKWKKATQDCWKQLQKGDFDWAHLAFSIWPERVRKKCVKDLSMAIAHGLEDICEVKPKEKVEKKIKEIKPDQQGKLI
jgi:hypothetical protein